VKNAELMVIFAELSGENAEKTDILAELAVEIAELFFLKGGCLKKEVAKKTLSISRGQINNNFRRRRTEV
jgi:hypothetical protein